MTYDASLGYDDAMPDAFDSWTQKLDCDEWLKFMGEYKRDTLTRYAKMKQENKPYVEIHTPESWLFNHFAEHVYPYLNNGDDLYDSWRDAQTEVKTQ